MNENPYSNRELDHYFKDLFEKMGKQDKTLERIEVQTTKHNGRMSKLEWWRSAFVWSISAIWGLILIVVPLLYKAFYRDLDYKIQTAVVQAVDNKIVSGKHEEN